MNQQQLILTRLLGKKEQKHIEGCQAYSDKCGKKNSDGVYICMYCSRWGGNDRYEEVSATPTLSDFHKWLVDSDISWRQTTAGIWFENFRTSISYDSSKDLLDQSPETLEKIIELITNKPMKPTLKDITTLHRGMAMIDAKGDKVIIDTIKNGRLWASTEKASLNWFILGSDQKSFDRIVEERGLTLLKDSTISMKIEIEIEAGSVFQMQCIEGQMIPTLETIKQFWENTHKKNKVLIKIEK